MLWYDLRTLPVLVTPYSLRQDLHRVVHPAGVPGFIPAPSYIRYRSVWFRNSKNGSPRLVVPVRQTLGSTLHVKPVRLACSTYGTHTHDDLRHTPNSAYRQIVKTMRYLLLGTGAAIIPAVSGEQLSSSQPRLNSPHVILVRYFDE